MKLSFHENNIYWNPYTVVTRRCQHQQWVAYIQFKRDNTGKKYQEKKLLVMLLLFIGIHKYSFRSSIYTQTDLSKGWVIH